MSRTRNAMRFRLGGPSVLALGVILAAAVALPVGMEPVTAIDPARVRAAFEKGAPLLETSAYKIHASRRDAAGQAEVHLRDTDLIYVLEGSATFVTGGRMVAGREVAPDEIRGEAIEGGETRRLVAGEVIVVPHGTPHWFRAVEGPFLYYVVKVSAAEPAR